MVLGCLRGELAKEVTDYIRKARHFPPRTIHCDLFFYTRKSLNLFGYKTMVLTHQLEKAFARFPQPTARRMAGMGPKRHPDRMWVYPPIGVALEMVVLEDIGVYINRLQNKVAQYIATRTITDFCLAAEWTPGMCVSRQWWEQPSLDIMGIRAG